MPSKCARARLLAAAPRGVHRATYFERIQGYGELARELIAVPIRYLVDGTNWENDEQADRYVLSACPGTENPVIEVTP